MPPRSSWKGFLRLSLVSVPVKAYTASATGSEVRLNQLHQNCHNRIRYKKFCPEHGEVQGEEIVSGYEYSKGQYVVIDPEELNKLRPQSDKSVNIHGFVAPEKVDALYYAGKTYYLVPDGAVGQKPYALLRKALEDDGLVALAEVVLSGREQLMLLRPLDDLLVLTALAYNEKVKKPDSFHDELTTTKISKEEMTLTKTLIDASTLKEFDYTNYSDTYVEKVTELIQAKVEGKEIVAVPDPEEPKILNLMDALKQSVEKVRSDGKKMAPSAKRKTASRRKKA